MKSKIHTVIFDLDGTLSDSAILTLEAFRKIAPEHRIPVPSAESIRRATGNANPEFYYILLPDIPRDLAYCIGQQVEQEEQRILQENPFSLDGKLLFNGCYELLTQLKERNIRLQIASTGDREHVFSILDVTGIKNIFEKISCALPDKTVMLRNIIKGDKSGYIMVGDMKKDYDAARANGILSVGACYGYCLREISNFDYYIDWPLDLMNVLEELCP